MHINKDPSDFKTRCYEHEKKYTKADYEMLDAKALIIQEYLRNHPAIRSLEKQQRSNGYSFFFMVDLSIIDSCLWVELHYDMLDYYRHYLPLSFVFLITEGMEYWEWLGYALADQVVIDNDKESEIASQMLAELGDE